MERGQAMVRHFSPILCLFIAATSHANDVVKVTAPELNVRQGPGTTFPVVGQIQYGERYAVAGTNGAWKKISFGPGTAWVHGSLVAPIVCNHQMVTASSLNVRSGPGTNYPIVGTAAGGSYWAVIGNLNGWKKIWYKGEKRWAHGAYLSNMDAPAEFTFVHWSDVHCGAYDFLNTWRKSWVQKMNALPGKSYPSAMGGTVGPISMAICTGDITEQGEAVEWNDYDGWIGDDYISLRNLLDYPSYEAMGNHDTWYGGAKAGITALHGNTYYSFNKGGIHFIALDQYVYGSSMAAKPDLVPAELAWLENDLGSIQKGVTPVVVFMHSPPKQSLGVWWTTMGETANDLKELLADHKVLLILHGHWHKTMKNTWNGWDLIGAGNAGNPEYQGSTKTTSINVIRVKAGQLAVVPFKLTTGTFEPPILIKTY